MSAALSRARLVRILIRWLVRLLLGGVALLALTYAGDWVAFALQAKPMDQVTVDRYLATPLKGNNTEVDFEGRQAVPCSRSVFPQNGSLPCWYLRRHPTQFDHP